MKDRLISIAKNRFVISLLSAVIVLPVGLVAGIWADWSAGLTKRPRTYVLQVEPYNQADLIVNKGDTVSIRRLDGSNAGLQMNFLNGDSPCSNAMPDCKMNGSDAGGEFLFSCGGGSGDQCPDPALQQKPTNPSGPQFHFRQVVYFDLMHLFGWKSATWRLQGSQQGKNGKKTTNSAAFGAYAYVDCNSNTNKTEIIPRTPPGAPDSTISMSTGTTMLWRPHDALTLTLQNGLCPAPAPSTSYTGLQYDSSNNIWSCVVGPQGTYKYTASLPKADCHSNISPDEEITVH